MLRATGNYTRSARQRRRHQRPNCTAEIAKLLCAPPSCPAARRAGVGRLVAAAMLRRDNNQGAPGSASRYGAPVGGPAGKAGPRGTSGLGPPRVGGPMTLLGGPKVSAARNCAWARRDT